MTLDQILYVAVMVAVSICMTAYYIILIRRLDKERQEEEKRRENWRKERWREWDD